MTFDNAVAKIEPWLKKEIMEMDVYLKSLRPLKFKRAVDKSGNKITYTASDYGISYAIAISDAKFNHHFGWYYIFDKQTQTWMRKTDYMEKTLDNIAKTDPQMAERIFNALNECTSCKEGSCSRISYSHNGQMRDACYGRVILRMNVDDFNDVRSFFCNLNSLMN